MLYVGSLKYFCFNTLKYDTGIGVFQVATGAIREWRNGQDLLSILLETCV